MSTEKKPAQHLEKLLSRSMEDKTSRPAGTRDSKPRTCQAGHPQLKPSLLPEDQCQTSHTKSLTINTYFFHVKLLRTATHTRVWLDARSSDAYATSTLKRHDETSEHFPMNIGAFSQDLIYKGRQHRTAPPQYSCIASSFLFSKRRHDENGLIRDENDLIRASCYNGCQIKLQRPTPASRLITALQYRYSRAMSNPVRMPDCRWMELTAGTGPRGEPSQSHLQWLINNKVGV